MQMNWSKCSFSMVILEQLQALFTEYLLCFEHSKVLVQFVFTEVSSAHQGCTYLIKSTVKNSYILKYHYNLKQPFFHFNIF